MAEGAKHVPVARRRQRAARLRRVEVRVSEAEYTALLEKGAAVGGMSKLLRDHLGKVSIRHREDERRRIALLNRINANLNAVAKWCNTYKSAADAVQVMVYLADVDREVRRVLAAMERL
jgi:hypothetical protein